MKRILIVILIAAVAAAAALSGCGKKKDAASKEQRILNRTVRSSRGVSSFRVSGSYRGNIQDPSAGMQEASYDLQANVEGPEDVDARGVVKAMGQSMDVYVVDGVMYANVPGQGWLKQSVSEDTGLGIGQELTPQEIAKATEAAQDIKMVSEGGKNYVIRFTISNEFFERSLTEAERFKALEPETLDIAKSLTGKMKATVTMTIEKSSYLVQKVRVKVHIPPTPPMREMSLTATAAFSDYGVPVTITLPPEAAGAREAREASSSSPVPGPIPGFGL